MRNMAIAGQFAKKFSTKLMSENPVWKPSGTRIAQDKALKVYRFGRPPGALAVKLSGLASMVDQRTRKVLKASGILGCDF